MLKLKVKAIIFDMDGVITNTMPAHFSVWKRIFKEEGIDVTKCEIYLREGQPGIVTIKEIFKERGRHFDERQARAILAKKERLFKKIINPLARIPCPPSAGEAMPVDGWRMGTSPHMGQTKRAHGLCPRGSRRRFIPDSRSFLHLLKKKGFLLALVTGTSAHEVRRILPKYLRDLFSVIVTGNDVKRGKPHPEPYLKALKKLKLKAKDVAVIENAPFGIDSAKRAKLTCLALSTSLSKAYLKDADFIFPSFKSLRDRVSFITV